MKPFFSKIDSSPQESYGIRRSLSPDFKGLWHYHPEIELHYVVRGEGLRFVGDNICPFGPGEIVLLGEHLPHCWRYENATDDESEDTNVETIILQFKPDCLGPYLTNLPEVYQVPILFEKARRGMVINGAAKPILVKLMQQMLTASGLERIILLLSVLKVLANCNDYQAITLADQRFNISDNNALCRMDQICNYTLNNFRQNISLRDVARSSNLNHTSFCRYFKMVTKRSYTSFLTQIRISQACRALIENRYTITAICYDCGFNNIANFYRHFKKVTGTTPHDYRDKYLKSNLVKAAS
ncbi:AraC family transcriptional regulator [Mucilaginibacter mali]|uniref:AraC family transcriptional regulator n=1 Tax=Mucilaginibacter mali TaxID=2740462 RepID=A0A7D4UM41_9SPHI|nr:AraC family transcriptional regulator [Mucilaginibacter mali]QKJ30721.1 AraC family transcriptional regulator [Mucilaginibacter mali]